MLESRQLRESGILLHISSLPSLYGIGDLGPGAYRFVDFMAGCGQHNWQVLPFNPTDGVFGNSPYSSISAFAFEPLFLSPDGMVPEGWLQEKDLKPIPRFSEGRVDYDSVRKYKAKVSEAAFIGFKKSKKDSSDYEAFCQENQDWLDDFAVFQSLKKHFGGRVWSDWPVEIRNRKGEALAKIKNLFSEEIEKTKFLQYVFCKQWLGLKRHCEHAKVKLIGDMPIYVNWDSADVWSHPGLFKLDPQGQPLVVAGVPPDYFSKTGQRWGNPIYQWDHLKETHYAWWLRRFEHNLKMFDLLRIDHFRGFIAFWEIPAQEKTAVHGQWVKAPTEDFFNCILSQFPHRPLIAEDLGLITPDVASVRMRLGLPGMKVLLFAFGGDLKTHPYLPENYTHDCVVYTGTHDNNTVRGWFEHDMTPHEGKNLFEYLGRTVGVEDISWVLIELAMKSKADLAIIPMQDILGLGQEGRMNTPATTKGNWEWRLLPGFINPELQERLLSVTANTDRIPQRQ